MSSSTLVTSSVSSSSSPSLLSSTPPSPQPTAALSETDRTIQIISLGVAELRVGPVTPSAISGNFIYLESILLRLAANLNSHNNSSQAEALQTIARLLKTMSVGSAINVTENAGSDANTTPKLQIAIIKAIPALSFLARTANIERFITTQMTIPFGNDLDIEQEIRKNDRLGKEFNEPVPQPAVFNGAISSLDTLASAETDETLKSHYTQLAAYLRRNEGLLNAEHRADLKNRLAMAQRLHAFYIMVREYITLFQNYINKSTESSLSAQDTYCLYLMLYTKFQRWLPTALGNSAPIYLNSSSITGMLGKFKEVYTPREEDTPETVKVKKALSGQLQAFMAGNAKELEAIANKLKESNSKSETITIWFERKT